MRGPIVFRFRHRFGISPSDTTRAARDDFRGPYRPIRTPETRVTAKQPRTAAAVLIGED